MRTELARLQEAVVALSRLSVDTMLKKVLDYASRPLPEFRKYEALEMVEALQNTARDNKHEKQDYYRLAYHTARSKIELPNDYFQSLICNCLEIKIIKRCLTLWRRLKNRGVKCGRHRILPHTALVGRTVSSRRGAQFRRLNASIVVSGVIWQLTACCGDPNSQQHNYRRRRLRSVTIRSNNPGRGRSGLWLIYITK